MLFTAAPLHWIYDQGKVKALTEAAGTVEFYPKPECPFYTTPIGSSSAYGDQVFVTLKNVAENKGKRRVMISLYCHAFFLCVMFPSLVVDCFVGYAY